MLRNNDSFLLITRTRLQQSWRLLFFSNHRDCVCTHGCMQARSQETNKGNTTRTYTHRHAPHTLHIHTQDTVKAPPGKLKSASALSHAEVCATMTHANSWPHVIAQTESSEFDEAVW